MKCNVILSAGIFLLMGSVCAQGTPIDQYKQMAGVAGLAEACYGSKDIPVKLNALIKRSVSANPQSADMLKSLLAEYNLAYKKSLLERKVWNGSGGAYSKPFSCAEPKDVDLIKGFELSILNGLK